MDYIAEKLGHHSADVRGRALESLDFKWKYGLISAADLLQERKALKGLLNLLSIGDGAQTTAVVLLLLRKLAAADAQLAKALLELGALHQLHAFTSNSSSNRTATTGSAAPANPRVFITPGVWPDELLPSVEALVNILLEPGDSSNTSSTAAAEAATDHSRAHSPVHAASLQYISREEYRSSTESLYSTHSSKSYSSQHYQQLHSGAGPSRFSSHAGAAVSGRPSTAARDTDPVHPRLSRATQPADAASRPASSAVLAAAAPAGPAGHLHRPGTANNARLHDMRACNHTTDRPGTSSGTAAVHRSLPDAAKSFSSPAKSAAPDGSDVSVFDERLLRARARAEWREHESSASGVPAWAPAPSSSQHLGHITLPVVALSASDDQALFELNVRLQYSDDERLLLPALLELEGNIGLDLPAEALLQRQCILDNCLALLSSSRSNKQVQQAAAAVLLQLIHGLKSSLALAHHAELAHSEFGDQLASKAAAIAAASVAGAGAPDSSDSGPGAAAAAVSRTSGSLLAAARLVPGFHAAASALAAATSQVMDPSCPNSYPQLPLPEDSATGVNSVWGLKAMAAAGNEQQRVDVTAAITSICLQVAELLSYPDRHYELLPIIEAALPLLVVPLAGLAATDLDVTNPQHQQHERWQAGAALISSTAAGALQLEQHEAQQLQEKLQAVWRGLLGALSRALASTAAVAADERAAAFAAALSGQSAVAGAVNGLVTGDAAAVLLAAGGEAVGAPAAAAVMTNGDQFGLCCWDICTLNLLTLALELINVAPSSWCTTSMIPPTLADAAAAAAADQALALLLPELRTSAAVLLQQLRPGSLAVLEAVQAVQSAAAAAEEVTGKLSHELQRDPATVADQWMSKVAAAVPSMGYNPRADAKLMPCVVHGLATVASTAHGVSSPQQQQVGQLLVQLLNHQQQQVQLQVLQLLSTAADAAEAQHSQPLQCTDWQQQQQQLTPAQQLIMLPAVTEHIVVQGLANQRTRLQASGMLLSLLQGLGINAARWLMPWRCWISCFAAETGAPGLAEALDSYSQQVLQQWHQQGRGVGELVEAVGFWQSPLVVVLQNLFSAQTAVRGAAGGQLLVLLMNGAQEPLDEYEELADDPFKGLLDSAASHSAALNSSGSSYRHHLPLDPLTDASASLAANFTMQDVRNLLGVLQNQSLAQELRRSAAEELLALSPEPQLLKLMVEPEHLEAVWSLCVPSCLEEDVTTSFSSAHLHVGAGTPSGDIFDMQLAVAALQLLAGLLARSAEALQWIVDDASRLLVPLLPLVLHALHSVRRAVARVLALAVFGNAVLKWSGFAEAAAAARSGSAEGEQQPDVQKHMVQQQQYNLVLLPDSENAVLMPEPFLQRYKFPFMVQPVTVTAAADAAATTQQPATQAAATQQQHAVIKQLVEQQQLLQLADNDPAAARAMLTDCLPVTAQYISRRVLSATANQLSNVDMAAVAQCLLAAVAAARNHAECEHALIQLERLGSSAKGLLAIASLTGSSSSSKLSGAPQQDDAASCQEQAAVIGWEAAFERLLSAAPISTADQRLWLRLLQLLERMLAVAPLVHVQYLHLQLLLQRSVTAWLQQPVAAKHVPRPPLALAMGTNSWECLKQQPSSAAAAAAVADMLGLNNKDAEAVAAAGFGSSSDGVLQVQVSRQALRVLLQLVKVVKQHCQLSSQLGQISLTACYSLSALQPAGLIRLLCISLLSRNEGVDYCCRQLAAALLAEVIGALQDVAQLQQLCDRPSSAGSKEASMRQLLLQVPGATDTTRDAGLTGSAPVGFSEEAVAVVDCLEPLICKVLIHVAGRQMPGFKGKALVKTTLEVLLLVVQGPLIAQAEWSQVWAAIGGTFWLSRLCRDREASIRWKAMTLVGQLLAPGAAATQALIAHSWPDCGHRLVRVASDACEAHAVRAAAMRAIAAAMVIPVNILQQQQPPTAAAGEPALPAGSQSDLPAKHINCLGLAPILQLEQLWEDLVPLCLLSWQQRPPCVTAAAAAMAATAMAAEPDGVGRTLLLRTGLVAAVLQLSAALLTNSGQHSSSSSSRNNKGRVGSLPAWQQQTALYARLLMFLQLGRVPHTISNYSSRAAAANQRQAAGSQEHLQQSQQLPLQAHKIWQHNTIQHQPSTLALQQRTAHTAAVVAAVQLLALAASPSSAGGGLLLLPAAVQQVLQEVPAVLLQLISHVGSELVVQQSAANAPAAAEVAAAIWRSRDTDNAAGGSVTAALSVLHHQLTLVHVAAAAVLASPVAAEAVGQRKQQLLQLLKTVDSVPQEQARQSASAIAPEEAKSSGLNDCGQGRLLAAVAACLSHPGSSPGLKLSLVQLVGLLMSDADVAAVALGSNGEHYLKDECGGCSDVGGESLCAAALPATEAHHPPHSGVGAALCWELASQLPQCIFAPTDAAAQGSSIAMPDSRESDDSAAPTVAPPEGLAVVLALQNLLTYSKAAKAAALEIGLHILLMETTTAMAAAIAKATSGSSQGSTAGGSHSGAGAAGVGGTRRVRARWFSSTAAATAAGSSTAASGASHTSNARKPSTVSVAFGRTSGPAALPAAAGAKKVAGPKVVGTAAAGAMPGNPHQPASQIRLRSSTLLSSASPAAATADGEPAYQALETKQGVFESAAEAAASTATAGAGQQTSLPVDPAAANTVGSNVAGPATGKNNSKQHVLAAARMVNMKKLLLSAIMLRHMAYRCKDTQAALVGNGLIELLLHLWPLALQQPALLLELLPLLNNLLPTCYQARLAVASLQLPNSSSSSNTLLQQVLCLLLPPSSLDQGSSGSSTSAAAATAAGIPDVVRSAATTLLHYASSEDGAVQLVKPGGGFLQDCQRVLRKCLLSCKKEHEPLQLKLSQQQRLTGLLQLLAVIAGRPHGQRAILQATVAPALVDLLAEVLLQPQQSSAVAAALLLLRNLSFSADLRSPVLANGQLLLLLLLLAAVESLGPAQPQQLLQVFDQGSLGRLGSSDGRSAPANGWVPLYGKPLVITNMGAGGGAGAGAGGAFSGGGATRSSASSRPGSPGVVAAGDGGASGAVPGAAGNVCCAVYAVSALWGLMYQGEKIKAAVRKLPAVTARLDAVRAQAQKLLEQHQQESATGVAEAEERKGSSRGFAAGAVDQTGGDDTAQLPDKVAGATDRGAVQQQWQPKLKECGTAGVKEGKMFSSGATRTGVLVVKPSSLCCKRGPAWWLQQLIDGCTCVLDMLEHV